MLHTDQTIDAEEPRRGRGGRGGQHGKEGRPEKRVWHDVRFQASDAFVESAAERVRCLDCEVLSARSGRRRRARRAPSWPQAGRLGAVTVATNTAGRRY